jgi:ElaB/YqjD/DUF883 family membrane-anchored ribosome-binding protein
METTKDNLISDFKVLLDDAEELLTATANQAGERVTSARRRIEQSLEGGKRSLAEAQSIFTEKAKDATEAAESYLRENPWSAVGIAAGIGMVLGLLVRRN